MQKMSPVNCLLFFLRVLKGDTTLLNIVDVQKDSKI